MATRPDDPPTCALLTGRNLRYFLTEALFGRGPTTVAELVGVVDRAGFTVRGRPSKTISDGLRWEIAHGRVVRLGKGRYGPGRMPKQTRSWIRCRVRRLGAPPAPLSRVGAVQTDAAGHGERPGRDVERSTRSGRGASKDDEVTVLGAGWSAEEEAADWNEGVEAALAALEAAAARQRTSCGTIGSVPLFDPERGLHRNEGLRRR
jgi:hypothetical protein